MYIYLMDNIVDLDFSRVEVVSSIENLINTAYEGYNIVDASYKTFKFILDNKSLGDVTISKLKQIISFNREHYSLFDSIANKIFISGLSGTNEKKEKGWILPLSEISYGKLAGLEIVAEDEDDAKLLIESIKHYKMLNENLRNFSTLVTPSNGGGANIQFVIQTKINAKDKVLVCFCDSDKLSLSSELGGVTKECGRISFISNFPCYFFHTIGREMENDLPHFFINQVLNFHNDPKTKANFLKLENIYENIDKNIFKYTDLKKGITFFDIKKITCMKSRQFWNESIELLNKNGFLTKSISDLVDEDIIVEHLSESIASNVLAWLEYKFDSKPNKVHEDIKNDKSSQPWLAHGENLFWLACGMKRGRI